MILHNLNIIQKGILSLEGSNYEIIQLFICIIVSTLSKLNSDWFYSFLWLTND